MSIDNITEATATISWIGLSNRNYTYAIQLIINIDPSTTFEITSESQTTTLLDSIYPGTSYTAYVITTALPEYNLKYGDCSPRPSVPVPFITIGKQPTMAPENLTINMLDSYSVNVTWYSPPLTDRGSLNLTYTIYCERLPDQYRANPDISPSIIVIQPEVSPVMQMQFVSLDSLEAAISYRIRICVSNNIGLGPCTSDIEFTTADDLPSSPPINLQSLNAIYPEITIQWSPPTPVNQHGDILFYTIRYTPIYKSALYSCGSATAHNLTTPNTSISFNFSTTALYLSVHVSASNSAGMGPYSDCINITINRPQQSSTYATTTIVISASAVGGLAIVLVIILIIITRRSRMHNLRILNIIGSNTTGSSEYHNQNQLEGELGTNADVFTDLIYLTALSDLEIDPSDISVTHQIGAGNYGIVRLGQHADYGTVAVKYLKDAANETEQTAFISEASRMLHLSHANVVCLLGVCMLTKPQFIVVEYMANGDLRSYLRLAERVQRRAITQNHMLRLATDVLRGVAYLHSMDYVHRDLAARNVLLDDSFHARIGDFGMSRHVLATEYYRQSASTSRSFVLPIRLVPSCTAQLRLIPFIDGWRRSHTTMACGTQSQTCGQPAW